MKLIRYIVAITVLVELVLTISLFPKTENQFWLFIGIYTFVVKPLFIISVALSFLGIFRGQSKLEGLILMIGSVLVYASIAGFCAYKGIGDFMGLLFW